MRRLWVVLLSAILVTACSAEIPRHPSAFRPPVESQAPATDAPATEAPAVQASADPSGQPGDAEPSAVVAVDTSAWVKLAPQGEVFTVLMPGEPKSSSSAIKTPGGDATQTTWAFTDAAKHGFAVTRVRMANGQAPHATAKQVLDAATDAISGSLSGAKLDSQTDVQVGSAAGRRLVLKGGSTTTVCLVVFAGDVVTPCVSSPTSAARDGVADAFLASFSLSA